jgi:hypothetical protein
MVTPNEMTILFICSAVSTLCVFFVALNIASISKDIKRIADNEEKKEHTREAVTAKGPWDIMH